MIRRSSRSLIPVCLLLLLIAALPLAAQTTTATVKGRVLDASGDPVSGAEVNAVNQATGFVHTVASGPDGSYQLAGLAPGTYNIVVASPAFEPKSEVLTVLVGQNINADFRLNTSVTLSESITVVGTTAVEMTATQISTNVTPEQMEILPQNDRNFMNFAELAPGLRLDNREFNKTFAAGAQTANAVNVFIDGISFKNDVLNGGVVGQDASRGNPFPQNAVREFRVLTQNFSAEYQKASSAVITAVTKSGTNDITGDVFGYYQDKALVERDPFVAANIPKPEYERYQLGASIGGPIIRDRAHFFVSMERNDQERINRVALGSSGSPEFRQQFLQYEGLFVSPFKLNLIFGKGTMQLTPSQIFDLSAMIRDETDERGFGGTTSFESAEEIVNDVNQFAGRHQFTGTSWLNEFTASYQDFKWNPRPLNEQAVGRNFQGIIRIGGRDTEQNFNQTRISLRDDFLTSALQWHGNHAIKFGANVDLLEYDVFKRFAGNPIYEFRQTENWEFPFEARYGLGDPSLGGDNTQFGLYVRDEWSPTNKLIVNAGLRWDYESDMFPTDYVTPAEIRQNWGSVLLDRFGQDFIDDYFTDGDDREGITNMFQPRLGISYDLFASGKTVLFGGWGRYYDRIIYNASLDERFRLQYKVGTFRFSRDGSPTPAGFPTVAWRDEYLTPAGLQQVLATGVTGAPEVFLIENDTKSPYSDQWNVGIRQAFGSLVGSLSYGSTRSYNGFTFIRGDFRPDNTCCLTLVPGYSRLLLSNDDVRRWYDAIYLSLEKPFSTTSRWGGQLAYTYSDALQEGGDLFSLDRPLPRDYGRYPVADVEEHRLVASSVIRIPWGVNFGTVIDYGSGTRYNINDQSLGQGVNERVLRRNAGETDDHLSVDLRVEKGFDVLAGVRLAVIAEAFNVFNEEFYTNYDGLIRPLTGPPNPTFGKPRAIVANSQRRFQYGLRVSF